MSMRQLPLRDAIWDKATERLNEGEYLPRWAIWLRAVLYPREVLGYALGSTRHWAIHSDTWSFFGVRFHGRTLRRLATSNGELYRINVDEGTVRISFATTAEHAADLGQQTFVDVEQVVHVLQLLERRVKWQADRLHEAGDLAADQHDEEARCVREAIALLLAKRTTTNPTNPQA